MTEEQVVEEQVEQPDSISFGAADAPVEDADETVDAPEQEFAEGEGEVKDERYWQSQFDKLNSEYEAKKPLVEKIEQYGPLLDYINNPEVLSVIEQHLQGGQTAVKPQESDAGRQSDQGRSQDSLPNMDDLVPPEMPADLDPYENPEAYKEFAKQQADYLRKLTDATNGIARQYRAEQEKRQAEMQRQQQIQQLHSELQQTYGAQPEQAQAVVQDLMERPQDVEKAFMEFMLQRHAPQKVEAKEPPKPQPRRNLNVPPPAAAAGSVPQPQGKPDMISFRRQ